MKFNITVKDSKFVYYKSKWKSWYKVMLGENVLCFVAQLCLTLYKLHELAPISMGFFRQEHWWDYAIFLSRGILLTQGWITGSPCLAGKFFAISAIREVQVKTAWAQIFCILTGVCKKKNSPTTIKLERSHLVLLHRRVRTLNAVSLYCWCLCLVCHYKIV